MTSLDHQSTLPRPGALPGGGVSDPLRWPFTVDTIKPARITYDPAKNEANIRKHGLPFSLIKDEFEWATALIGEDTRKDYGEKRYEALGHVGRRLHVVVYTRAEQDIRVISFRKANRREVRKYEKATQPGVG